MQFALLPNGYQRDWDANPVGTFLGGHCSSKMIQVGLGRFGWFAVLPLG